MTFYHYTSSENYERIKMEGLVPYHIQKPELDPYFPEGIFGVWLWQDDLKDDEHVGSILWQLMTKAAPSVVKLKIDGNEDDLLRTCVGLVVINHDGRLGKWDYHRQIPAVVMTKTIPPSCIEMVKEYNLLERLS